MQETILKAFERTEKPQQARRAGFIPGVIMGEDKVSTSVKFEASALNKIVTNHGKNAKIWIEYGDEKNFGIIMELQKHPVEGKIIHASIKLFSAEQTTKMSLPIVFHGREELEHRMLELHVYKSDIEVSGKAALMPDKVVVDVSTKNLTDIITAADFKISDELKVLDEENITYAVFRAVREEVVEEPEEVKPETV